VDELGGAQASSRFFDDPLDGEIFDAPARLRAPALLLPSEAHIKQWDMADWQSVDPRLRFWSAMFCEAARKRGIPLYVHSAFRSEAEQTALLKAGRTKAPYPSSAHNIGEAVDIVHGVYHWALTKQEWLYLSKLGQECLRRLNSTLPVEPPHRLVPWRCKFDLKWGGSWSFYDPAHWEISDFRERLRRVPVAEPLRYTPRYIWRHLRP